MNSSNIVFTIVAKNYLPLAFVLGDSLKRYNPDIKFYILLADTVDEINLELLPYEVFSLEVLNLSVDELDNLAFKYNITEFCTAVKPYFFEFLFDQGFENAIYFDPDICLFNSIEEVFKELDTFSIVVTPHFVFPQIKYTGTITESLLLHVGIFNFGFIAVKGDSEGALFINWWKERLFSKCFQDKIEAYHTDQKWGDLLPALFGNKLLISKDIGRNLAIWNLHERKITNIDGIYFVENRLMTNTKDILKFVHFAGFDIINPSGLIHKNHPEYKLANFPELKEIYRWYGQALYDRGYKQFISFKYGFDHYENKEKIVAYHRRFFRRLTEDGFRFEKPFSTGGANSFYQVLAKNGLLNKSKDLDYAKMGENSFPAFGKKLKYINLAMKLLIKFIGNHRYFLLLKFCQRYFRPENQTFLLKQFEKHYYFLNENRQYKSSDKVESI